MPSAASADAEVTDAEEAYKAVIAQTDGLAALLSNTAAGSEAFTLDETGKVDAVLSMGAGGSDTLSVPADPSDPIVMTRSGGTSIGVSVAGTPTRGKAAGAGMVLFEDVAKETDVLVQPQNDAGVRVLTVIKGSQAPTEFEYSLKLDVGHKLFPMEDGRVGVVDSENVAVALIETPWAYDAQGNAVPASYTVSGSILSLNVAHDDDTAYPVLADPVFTWGHISGTVYFSHDETGDVAYYGLPTPLLGLLIPHLAGIHAAAFLAETVYMAWDALIEPSATCLKIRYGFVINWRGLNQFATPGMYRDEAGITCSYH